MIHEWDDTAKAQWILEHGGIPDIAWIFERVDDKVYRRPMVNSSVGAQLPPWINKERELVLSYTTPGHDITDLNINEHSGRHT